MAYHQFTKSCSWSTGISSRFWRFLAVACFFFSFSVEVFANNEFDHEEFRERHEKISSLISTEDYAEAANAIEEQISWLISLGLYDSLYHYSYNIGRAYWRSESAQKGTQKSKELVNLIIEKSTDSLNFFKILVDLSWIYSETGEFYRAFQTDSIYVEFMQKIDGISPGQQYTGYYNLAFGYYSLGNFRRAVEYFSKAVDVLQNEPDISAYINQIIDGYNALGAMHHRAGNHRAALTSFEKALSIIEGEKSQIDSLFYFGSKANLLGNQSLIFYDLGNIIQSKELLEEVIRLRNTALEIAPPGYRTDQLFSLQMSSYRNLAALYQGIGDYNRAETILEYVLEKRRETLAPDDPRIISTLEGFVSIHLSKGDLELAMKAANMYLESCVENFGLQSYYTASAYQQLGKIHQMQGAYKEAINSYSKAMQLFSSVQEGELSTEIAQTYLNRSETHLKLKNFGEAKSDLDRAFEIFSLARDEWDLVFSQIHLQRATTLFHEGKLTEAREEARMALEKTDEFKEQFQEGAADYLITSNLISPNILFLLAQIQIETDDGYSSRKSASALLDRAITLINQSVLFLEGEESRLSFYESFENIFNLALDNTFEMYALSSDPSYLRRFFSLSEENKTIMLRNQLNLFSSISFSGIPDSLVEAERKLNGWLTGRLPIEESGMDVVELEWEYNQLLDYISQHHPEYYELRHSGTVTDLDEFKTEFVVDGLDILIFTQTDSFYYCLIINNNSTELLRFNSSQFLASVDEFHLRLNHPDLRSFRAVGEEMFRIVFEPLEKYLAGNQLLIIPDKDFFNINFDALIRPEGGEAIHFLIYDYTISYLLSANTAIQYRQLERTAKNAFLAFAPGFSDVNKQDYAISVSDSLFLDLNYLSQLPQPFAVQSLKELSNHFSGRFFTGIHATREKFFHHAQDYRVIHFGTHAEINNQSPLLSRLILSKDNENYHNSVDGYLYIYDLYNTQLNADLAVLMACETGEGKRSSSEGIVSLAHGFAYAGCPGIIMAMWKIDEKTSSSIITNFYKELLSGYSKSNALRNAKLNMLKKSPPELKAPFYWAGLILVGEDSPVELATKKSGFPLILTISLLAVLFFAILFFFAGKTFRNSPLKD